MLTHARVDHQMGSQLKYVLAGAETLKADGNALFSKNQYAAAIEKYGRVSRTGERGPITQRACCYDAIPE